MLLSLWNVEFFNVYSLSTWFFEVAEAPLNRHFQMAQYLFI